MLRVPKSSFSIFAAENLKNGDFAKLKFVVAKNPVQTASYYIIQQETVIVFYSGEIEKGDKIQVAGKVNLEVIDENSSKIRLYYPEIVVINDAENNEGVLHGITKAIESLQERFSRVATENLPEPHGSLLVGILLGLKRAMPQEFYDLLVNTGTLHVIAASGFNITIIAKLLIDSLGRVFPKRIALFASFFGIAFYTLLAGAGPAVVRAALMGSISYFAVFLGKEYWASWSLVVVSLIMVLVDPGMLTDVGFWLSVTATGGILWLSKDISEVVHVLLGLERGNSKDKGASDELSPPKNLILKSLAGDFATTMAAQIATLPVLILVFGRVSLLGPIVNLFLLWLVPLIMGVGGIKLLFGLLWGPLGYLAGVLVWMPLEVFVKVVEFFGNLSFVSRDVSNMTLEEGGVFVVAGASGYYLLLFVWVIRRQRSKK
jgi:competence protein ComEC